MDHHHITEAAIAVSLALAAGMLAQSVARHLKIPGIVLLLGAGVLLGPDVAGIVQPEALGPALQILVGFAVAVILFEGGMNLNLKRLRREVLVIRRLLTVGVVVTAAGGAVAARYVMGWEWKLSILFGTLVIVTGPTVVTPLLRRIKLHHRVETVLEAEGVLIDAVGAVIAVVALQIVIGPQGSSFWYGPVSVLTRLGGGLVFGVAGGLLLALLLRYKRVVPDGLENVFTLSMVLALFQTSNALIEESGIMTATAAGMVMGNVRTRVQRDLMEFKEQLTVMFIGMLFVLLAADVRLAEIGALGLRGVAAVVCLMLLVRPLSVALSTIGSELTGKERLFLSWLAPRGIVAAAVASFFAQSIPAFGIEGGDRLRALVFMVIAVTVLLQGLTSGTVARWLGLRRPAHRGFAILGANELGHALGRQLRELGQEVVFIDSSPTSCHIVERDGFKVVFGNAMEERTLQRAQIEDRTAFVAVTPNEEINYVIAREAIEEFKVPRTYVALRRSQATVSKTLVRAAEGAVLFGKPRDLELWAIRLRRGIAPIEEWRLETPAGGEEQPTEGDPFEMPETLLLPLVVTRGAKIDVVNGRQPFRDGDVVRFAVFEEQREQARDWLRRHGWTEVES